MAVENYKRPLLSPKERRLATVPPADVLVDDPDTYFAGNHGAYRELPNGMTVIGFARETVDNNSTEVIVTFPHYPMLDGPHKNGLTHLTEHMLLKRIKSQMRNLRVFDNGFTAHDSVDMLVKGVSNPTGNVGIFPVVPFLRDALADSFAGLSDPEAALDGERKAVLDEINAKKSKHERRAWFAAKAHMLANDNPYSKGYGGLPEHLATMTVPEVQAHAARIVTPRSAIVEVFAQGDSKVNNILVDTVADTFADFPRIDVVKEDLADEIWALTHPDLQAGTRRTHDLGLPNDQVSVFLVWQAECQDFSQQSYALRQLDKFTEEATFRTSREEGWGYYTTSGIIWAGPRKRISYIQADMSRTNGNGMKSPEEFADQMLASVRNNVIKPDMKALSHFVQQERELAQVNPISMQHRLSDAKKGILEWGLPLDSDKISRLKEQVGPSDLAAWQQQFLDTPPAVLIIGDLRGQRPTNRTIIS